MLPDELVGEVNALFSAPWDMRNGQVVPDLSNIALEANEAVRLSATILYADLADSTPMVDNSPPLSAAEVYRAFLHSAARAIRSEHGVVTAYDGDRVMAVFIDDKDKNTRAVRAAFKINHAVALIVNPAIRQKWPDTTYVMKHVVGIDTSEVHVARAGVRGATDLVWIGRAANHAAKLAALPSDNATYISANVYQAMHESVRLSIPTPTSPSVDMWRPYDWTGLDGSRIYGSSWRWWP